MKEVLEAMPKAKVKASKAQEKLKATPKAKVEGKSNLEGWDTIVICLCLFVDGESMGNFVALSVGRSVCWWVTCLVDT